MVLLLVNNISVTDVSKQKVTEYIPLVHYKGRGLFLYFDRRLSTLLACLCYLFLKLSMLYPMSKKTKIKAFISNQSRQLKKQIVEMKLARTMVNEGMKE